ncbi:hypothetical protein Tco_0267927 [Tanacetum coccineum]
MTPRSKLRLKSLITSSFFNSRLKIFWDNLRPLEWTFTRQTQVFPYGTVELSQNSGPNFKVNGHRLKHYFGGDIPTEDSPDCEDSRALSLIFHSQEFHIPSDTKRRKRKWRIAEDASVKDRYWKIPFAIDNDEDDPLHSPLFVQFEEPITSLSMGTSILTTIQQWNQWSNISPSWRTLSLSKSDMVVNSNDNNSSSDDDSPYVDPEVERIDDDILLTIKDDTLREKLLNVNLLIAKIDALRDNPTPSSDVVTKSTSTFSNLFLEETNTFDNSIPESETYRFNLEEISSGSSTTHSELSLPDYKAFYIDNDHFKEKSSGSTTTHVDFSRYDSFIFDLSNDQFPPADRSDLYHEEFADELTHIMSLPNLKCFKFKIEPDPGDLTSIDPEIRKNVSTTNVNVPLEDDQSSLFAYVVWIFLAFLTYPVVPPYLLSTGNEDTIFDPGISIYHSFMPDVSHRSGTFMKFNDFPDCEDSRARSFALHPQEFHILSFILGI